MKTDIHPQYYTKAKVTCACGNVFTVGSTLEEIHVEICSNCHPFYTGKQKLVDSARRVEKFQDKLAKKQKVATGVKGKKAKRAATQAKKTANTEKASKKSAKGPLRRINSRDISEASGSASGGEK